MKLVVVESPSKAKTINKYLGSDYKVVSSVGHIIDLPKSKLGVDIEHNYEPQYQVIEGKKKVIKELQKFAKESDLILLATDPDREGEAISWHIKNSLEKIKSPIARVVFHEITKNAVLEALKNPREIDQNLVDAQQARRVLDRLVGYTLSPLLWKKIRYGLSAGRVQSVALRLIVDRERERQAFVAEEYWSILVVPVESAKKSPKITVFLKEDEKRPKIDEGDFILDLKKINDKKAVVSNQETAKKIFALLESNPIIITDLKEKQVRKRPYPPFITSTFQQAAVNTLGMTSKSAMRSAQKLYEAGLITYMRTDSFALSNQAVEQARKVVKKDYGSKYLPEKANFYKTRSKSAQEAHEAIRPTNFETRTLPKSFSAQEQKVYDLIFKRALATQMSDAVYTQKTATAETKTNDKEYKKLTLSATGQKCEFDGWQKLYSVKQNLKLVQVLEKLKVSTKLFPEELIGIQHFTEPPARYTEASLIKALEKYGIGRPSTYASIVSVIMQRTYVEKDGKYFYPTDTGFVVTDLLKNHFDTIVDIDFTAGMEQDLDEIAQGKIQWQPKIHEFFSPFQQRIKKKDKEINKEEVVILGSSDEKCDDCGAPMVKKLGRYGAFLSCSTFPDCKGMKSLEGESESSLAEKPKSEEFQQTYKPAPKTEDGRDYILKKGRYGEFWAHPDYPKVKDAKPLEYTDAMLERMFGKPPQSKDGKTMILRKGRYGFFWAHPDYPKTKEIQKIKKKK